jgi:peptide/nickel transport system permease protein
MSSSDLGIAQRSKIRSVTWSPRALTHRLVRLPVSSIAGVLLLAVIFLFTFPGAVIYGGSPFAVDPIHQTEAPSGHMLLGTDQLGRDELARLIMGGQASLYIGFAASFVAVLVGLAYGLSAGVGPTIADRVLMRLLDAVLAVPTVVILILLSSLYRLNDVILILLLGLTSWPRTARVVRNETFAVRSRDFVTASRQFGGGTLWIARTHILRMILPVLMVNFVFLIADNIIALSFLSFLGLGVQPPTPSWGNLLNDGLQNIFSNAWWLIYPAGAMIFLTVVSVNLIGEGVVAGMEHS